MDDNNEDLFTSLSDETINPDESIDVENERTDDLPREEDENIVSMIQTLLMTLLLEQLSQILENCNLRTFRLNISSSYTACSTLTTFVESARQCHFLTF